MNYNEELRKVILTKGVYDEDLKMTVLALKEDINARSDKKTFLTVMVDDEDRVLAGADRKGTLTVETLTDRDAQVIYLAIRKAFDPPRRFTANMAALVIAALFFICFTLKS